MHFGAKLSLRPIEIPEITPQQLTEISYDLLDRKVREVTWGWNVAAGTWDAAPSLMTQYSYDPVGRLQCTAVRLGTLSASACDQSSTSNPADRITKNIYDDASQLVQVRKAVGTSIEQAYVNYSYTLNGKQEYFTDANGNKARLTYDGHDRQAQWQFPSVTTPGTVNTNDYEEYGYDLNGGRRRGVRRHSRYRQASRTQSYTSRWGGASSALAVCGEERAA